ncbi:uncharacterized protein LOC133178966 [Saccostrea echinata]|uniref:uncharacterized protein LOC133178966 n=1 Tax=Saccostrea echinata TaxID=191078 RepID=UPI002A80F92D|nr:uncharacterized protein LOC133178966 [Saccostrea echinata]
MGINNSKLNCASRKAREEPYRQVKVDEKTKDENGDHLRTADKKNGENFVSKKNNSASKNPKGDHLRTDKKNGGDIVPKDNSASNPKGQTVQEIENQVQNGQLKDERNTNTTNSKSTVGKLAVKEKEHIQKKESKEMYSDDEPKPYDFVKAIKTDYVSGNFTPSKGGSTEVKKERDRTVDKDETNPKSVNNQTGSSDETEIKQSYGPSLTDGEDPDSGDHSSLEKDCLPSLNSEDRREGLGEEFVDADHTEYNEQQEKSKKNTTLSKDDENTTESDDSDDDGDEDNDDEEEEGGVPGNYNFGYVTNMIIGKGKIIDRETVVTSKTSSRSKNSSKAKHSSKGKNSSKGRKKFEKGSNKSKGKTVNAENVRNLGIGKVNVLKETTIVEHPKSVHVPTKAEKIMHKTEPLWPGLPVSDMDELRKVTFSVGMIHGFKLTGSVFRVGKDKIFTAWHVVRGIICVDNHSRRLDYKRLADPGVFVDFGYEETYQADCMNRFPVEPNVLYYNEKLDIAVLQLKQNTYGMPFPKALTNFDKFTQEMHENHPIYLVGHTNALRKSLDLVMKYWHPFDHRIKELSEWYENEFDFKHGYGFTGIKDKTRLLFQCQFRHGASGCPGFIVRSKGDIRVVTVLLRGFPDFYYFSNFTEEERLRVPIDKLIQQGSDMEAIWKDVESKNKELYREIFHYKDYISHSEKNQPVATPSEEKVLNFPQSPASTGNERKSESSGGAVTCIPRVASGKDPLVMLASGKSQAITGSDKVPTESTSDTGEKQPEATIHTQEIPVQHERVQTEENNTSSTVGSQLSGERNNTSEQTVDDAQTVRSSGGDGSRCSTSSFNRQMSEITTSAFESECAEIRQQANNSKSASASKVW